MLRTSESVAPSRADRVLGVAVAGTTAALFGALAFLSWADALGLLTLAVGAAVVLLAARRLPRRAARFVLLGLVLRISVALIQYYVTDLPDSTGDAGFFEFFGFLLSRGGRQALIDGAAAGFPAQSSPSYSWFIGLVYFVLGVRTELTIQALNVLFGALAVVMVSRAALLLWGERSAVRVAAVTALFPALVLYSGLVLREAPMVFLLSLVGLRVVEWSKSGRWRPLFAAAFYAGLAGVLHVGALSALLAVALVAAYAALQGLGPQHRRRAVSVLLVLAVGGGLYLLSQASLGLSRLGNEPFDAEALGVKQAQRTLRGGAAYLTGLQLRSWFDVLWQGPIRVFYLLFTPFPWQISSAFQLVGLFDAAAYWWLAATLFRHRRQIWANPDARLLILVVSAVLLAYGLGTSNFGTAIRHRQKVAALMIALAGAGWRRAGRRSPALRSAEPAGPGLPGA